MGDSDGSLNLFLNGIVARDIAESLPSFDDTAAVSAIRSAMDAQQWDVVGIRKSGIVAGWLAREDVETSSTQISFRPFDPATIIADTASLNEVVKKMTVTKCLFVRSFGKVNGLVRIRDLRKPPMRMWLFGLVTITELRVTRMINEICPQGSWQRYLSEGRINLAKKLQEERRRRHLDASLLDCLQLADKGKIVARDETLRRHTRFPSKRDVETFVDSLQNLRNNLAHAQDISSDLEIIRDLASNVYRIVLGPSAADAEVPNIEATN